MKLNEIAMKRKVEYHPKYLAFQRQTKRAEYIWNLYAGIKPQKLRKFESLWKDHATYAAYYARDVLNAPWPEAEDAIARSGEASIIYACQVLHGRFEKGEKAIKKLGPQKVNLYYQVSGIDLSDPDAEYKEDHRYWK